jgi:ABC-2 type transport system ATP-binding protein
VPVEDSFELLRDIYRISPEKYRTNRDRLTELLDLGNLLGTPVRQLSLGQRMRCELAASLLHGPKILFLDEPSIGLDAPGKLAVRRFIRSLNKDEGVTVILTSHDMNDIEALARRVILIGQGTILYDGTLDTLRARFGGERTVSAYFNGPGPQGLLAGIPGVQLVDHEAERATWRVDPRLCPVSDFIARLSAESELADVKVEDPPVEEVIARLYKEHRL